jgi:hypothetical protein
MRNKPADIPYCGVDRAKILSARPIINADVLRMYVSWIKQRAHVYYMKEIVGEPGPWTTDPILSKYKFTNIRRELDRETKWLIDNVINSDKLSILDKALNCALFRCINTGQYFQEVWHGPLRLSNMKDFDFNHLNDMERDSEYSGPLQSNAYFLSQMRRVANDLCKRQNASHLAYSNTALAYFIWFHRRTIEDALAADTPSKATILLETIPGFGKFMSYQVWVDWTYMEDYEFSENEFVLSGPGCDLGLSYLFKDQDGMSPEETLFWMRDNLVKVCRDLEIDFDPGVIQSYLPPDKRNFGVMQHENGLCELSKYYRLHTGERMRARYYAPGTDSK